jgi:Uma2 family endonuclease
MQTVLEKNYNQIFVPSRAGVIHFKIEFEDEPRKMTSDEFWEFCSKNPKLNAELTKEGEIIIMPPTGWNTTKRNAKIIRRLGNWAEDNGEGEFSESNGGFILPNGATRSPDAAWILKSRLETLSTESLEKFLPLCPDFVIEMTSPSDSLSATQSKMVEYIENGAQLGWLIHSKTKQVFIYRPNQEVEILENPSKVSGESLLTGFELDLTEIW